MVSLVAVGMSQAMEPANPRIEEARARAARRPTKSRGQHLSFFGAL